jgi:DNA polymerase V
MRQWIGLPVCVGMSPSKTLGKLANYMVKKNSSFNGVCDLTTMDPAQCDALMAPIEAGEVWGVGRRIQAHLRRAGIRTVKDLRDTPPAWLRSRFGVVMERTAASCVASPALSWKRLLLPKKRSPPPVRSANSCMPCKI